MRLGNPKKAKLFDRCPRSEYNQAGIKGISTQSSALKYQSFEFRKLGLFLTGDLVELETMENVEVPGEPEGQPCILFFHVKSFYVKDFDYYANGDIFLHSTSLRQNLDQLESHDCYVEVKNLRGRTEKLETLKFNKTLRAKDLIPSYSRLIYDEYNPGAFVAMSHQQHSVLKSQILYQALL